MKPFEKFLESSVTLRELLDNYLELRQHLQEMGFSQEQLSRFMQPTVKMMSLREKFINKKNALFRQIKDYGFEIHQGELTAYIQPLLNKIDEPDNSETKYIYPPDNLNTVDDFIQWSTDTIRIHQEQNMMARILKLTEMISTLGYVLVS